jgi:hypothetical protein
MVQIPVPAIETAIYAVENRSHNGRASAASADT